MVSIGTVFTIGIIGAVAAAGYAVYRNADAIGSALSRGVEGYFTNPLGNWVDDLFRNLSIGPGVKTNGETSSTVPPPPGPGEEGTGFWEGLVGTDEGPALPADKNLTQVAFEIWYNEHFGPKEDPPIEIIDETPPGPIPQSEIPTSDPIQSLAGWYYRNFAPGGRADEQIFLKEGTADRLTARGYDLRYLGQDELGEAGFQLFGKSQGYL